MDWWLFEPPARLPGWEQEFPRRLSWEISVFRRWGVEPVIDWEAWESGDLVMKVIWPVGDRSIPLRIVYPDSFPTMQPQVFMDTPSALFPRKHCSPSDGQLCLVGRGNFQWKNKNSIGAIIASQLPKIILGYGMEDPQAEPAEVAWNQRGLRNSYLLIDSAWDLRGHDGGTLKIIYVQSEGPEHPEIRAIVTEVLSNQKSTVAKWVNPVPLEFEKEGAEIEIPWVREKDEIFPRNPTSVIQDLSKSYPQMWGNPTRAKFRHSHKIWSVVVYSSELTLGARGDAWSSFLILGSHSELVTPISAKSMYIVPVCRAGVTDVLSRVPNAVSLRGKTVTVFGLGSLGAPIAIELAKNGVGKLNALDFDIVEPGNTVRWPIGQPSWGRPKQEALADYIRLHYPLTEVVPCHHLIGSAGGTQDRGDIEVIDRLLRESDLVIDATAAYGVTDLLFRRLDSSSPPMISLYGTPTMEGGVVTRYEFGGACPACLVTHQVMGTLPSPRGSDSADDTVHQPIGCGAATFTGASYELLELVLQACRRAVESMSKGETAALVDTLDLGPTGEYRPPIWCTSEFEKAETCSCSKKKSTSVGRH